MERPTIATPLRLADLAEAILYSWPRDLDPTRGQVELVLAHIHGETGLDKCKNWNLGNEKHFGGDADFCRYRCSEVVTATEAHREVDTVGNCRIKWEVRGRAELICEPAHRWSRFRSFPDLFAGADHYLQLMRSKKLWWEGVLSGDPAEFSKKLKAAKYYTAPLGTYTKLVQGRLAIVRAELAGWNGWGDVA